LCERLCEFEAVKKLAFMSPRTLIRLYFGSAVLLISLAVFTLVIGSWEYLEYPFVIGCMFALPLGGCLIWGRTEKRRKSAELVAFFLVVMPAVFFATTGNTDLKSSILRECVYGGASLGGGLLILVLFLFIKERKRVPH
jgi:hypothetical protein